MNPVIWWIRRDLRLENNPTLAAALEDSPLVIPLFILDEHLLKEPAHNRQLFLMEALRELDRNLKNRGAALIIRSGKPLDVLRSIIDQIKAHAIFAEEDYSPYAIRRDAAVQKELPLKLISGLVIHHPEEVLKPDGEPYTVFTPYSKSWKALPKVQHELPAPQHFTTLPGIASEQIPAGKKFSKFPASEMEAQQRLTSFIQEKISQYDQTRNRLDLDGTSSLSPYFRFGILSIQQAFHAAQEYLQKTGDLPAKKGVETWINELIWREFYIQILYHYPYVLNQAYQPHRRNIPWRSAPKELLAWQQGLTGYPVVDACMRQLSGIGWMHNRGRMIVASFLVKDLLINWQEGEKWFMQHLVDGDPAANNGGWQWTAGVGTDAAPYFRIFNPILQSKKFDPDGNFIRKWVPELRSVPNNYIHEPWTMPDEIQRDHQCKIGKDYPPPIVDHQLARERTLAAYKKA